MIHRAIYGSLERFIGILIEHYGGKFPVWLSPTQVIILPVSDKFLAYARKVDNILKQNNIRSKVDEDNERLSYKIRKSQEEKIPYMLIVGQKEEDSNTVSVRSRDKGDIGSKGIDEFTNLINSEIGKVEF
jgi:threonyl-tRNA synthetase